MKKIISKSIFFVETILFFISVHLVPFFEKKRFAAKLILANDFFIKNKLTKTAVFFALLVIFSAPTSLLAQSSEFTISTQVVDDLVPPTTPTMLSVLPVAFDQIDVAWSASTDNFLLGGYVLLRDGSPIATTTLTTYIDTGLTASTTYAYEVYAFDTFYTISTTSNSLATTTLEAPVVPPTPTSTAAINSSATRVLQLDNFEITTQTNSANFWWQTNARSRFTLRWGRNDAYDDGYILNDIYRNEHQTLVGDLEPGTVYLYELIGYGNNGIAISLKQGQFKTEARENITPANVQNLQAVVEGSDVTLSFVMPSLVDAPKVRIVRSYLGYPVDPYDGALVYEGEANIFFDRGALTDFGSQYYTVFVITKDGTVSSGAVVKAKRKTLTTATSTQTEIEEEEPLTEELVEIPDFGFLVENISITQGEARFNFNSEGIYLSENDAFLISIPYESLPKHLKSIIVTLLDRTDQNRSYAFLLRINKSRTAYEATIAPLKVFGTSRLQIEIYDYERQIIGRYRKQIDFVVDQTEQTEVIFPDKLFKVIQPIFSTFSLIFLIILLILYLIYRRSRETEDNR